VKDVKMPRCSVVPLIDKEQIAGFESSNDELTAYLHEEALRDQSLLLATTHLLVDETGSTLGYLSLLTDSIKVKVIGDHPGISGIEYASIPALKIGRLTCRRGYEGKGLGTEMIRLALSYLFEIVKYSGCRIMTVDSKKGCEGFYELLGFKKTTINKHYFTPMYLDVIYFLDTSNYMRVL